MKKKKKVFRIRCVVFLCLVVVGISAVTGINIHVKASVSDRVLSQEQAAELEDIDCIIVLGCMVNSEGQPSHMLEDRLKRGVALYEQGAAPKLLMSGDHGQKEYDEVNAMKQWAVDRGAASADVFMDHAGFSTYESVYRAKEIFGVERIVIVSQEYHLYRALYIAEKFGLEAYGVAADYRTYAGQFGRDVREVLARCKDFAMTVFKPEPTFLGDAIPISGSGDATNDR